MAGCMIKIVVRKCLAEKCILHQKRMVDQAAFKGMGGKWLSFGIKDPDLYAKKIMLGACPMKFSPQVLT